MTIDGFSAKVQISEIEICGGKNAAKWNEWKEAVEALDIDETKWPDKSQLILNDHAKIEMKGCPLVDLWEEMELSEDQICRMCDMAYRIDFGTIEPLGYELVFPTRIACGEPSCILEIKKKK